MDRNAKAYNYNCQTIESLKIHVRRYYTISYTKQSDVVQRIPCPGPLPEVESRPQLGAPERRSRGSRPTSPVKCSPCGNVGLKNTERKNVKHKNSKNNRVEYINLNMAALEGV